jgi:hypothetical protein
VDSDLLKLLKKSRKDPVFFVENILGINSLWEKQREILESIRDNRFTTIRSCHGSGKSFTTSLAVAWYLSTHPYSIVITTAPTGRQVREVMWQEIAKNVGRAKFPLGGRMLTTSWQIAGGWYALGFSSDEADRFQGFHAKEMLVVVDEACGVPLPIFEGIDSLITAESNKLLLIGNPTNPEGRFYDSFKSPLYHKIHISAFETPNLVAGRVVNPHLVTPRWVEDRRTEWGEDSPAWISRVLGQFPETSSDTFISLNLIDASLDNDLHPGVAPRDTPGPCVVACDPARFGDDESILVTRRGDKVTRMEWYYGVDGVQLARHMLKMMTEEVADIGVVDTNGNGSGVFDVLFREYGVQNVMGFMSQEQANDRAHYVNKRVEAWAALKERMRKNKLDLTIFDTPKDREAIRGQLSGPKYKYDASGRYQLERKEDMKKRGLKSPDRADAIALAFYYEGQAGVGQATWTDRKEEPKPGTLAWVQREIEREAAERDLEREEYEWLKMEVGE